MQESYQITCSPTQYLLFYSSKFFPYNIKFVFTKCQWKELPKSKKTFQSVLQQQQQQQQPVCLQPVAI